MKALSSVSSLALIFCCSLTLAQEAPVADEGHAILKQDVGTWKAKTTMYMGDTTDVSEGKEVNRMVGDFWLLSEFSGQIMGGDFQGVGNMGYDPESKKYVGSWIDSMSVHPMHTSGTWDPKTRTMTVDTTGKFPDGSPMKGQIVTVYSADGKTRKMTMSSQMPGSDEMSKQMDIEYKRVDEAKK